MNKRVLLFGSACILAALIGIYAFADRKSWHPLAGGGQVRLFGVIYGGEDRLVMPTRSWASHYRKLMSRSLRTLSPYEFYTRERSMTATGTKSNITVWFQVDPVPPRVVSYHATLAGSDGSAYEANGANGPSTDGYAYTAMKFPVISADPVLHLTVEFDGRAMQFEAPNPAWPQGQRIHGD
jgi:hypothetical protein